MTGDYPETRNITVFIRSDLKYEYGIRYTH